MRTELAEAIEALHLIAGGNESEIERPLHEIVNAGLRALLRDGASPHELSDGTLSSIFDADALADLK